MRTLASLVDSALEASIVGSFTRFGSTARRSLESWTDPAPPGTALAGRVMVVSGATSGLGEAAAFRLAGAGATVVIVARNEAKASRTIARLVASVPRASVSSVLGDTGCLDDMRRVADTVERAHGRVDVLIHNAGSLDDARSTSPEGLEATVASHVVGPFVLTARLLPALRRAASEAGRPSRVIWMSSGGMYAEPLTVAGLDPPAEEYDGVVAYARAKRAQITLTELLGERLDPAEIVVHAMHPGWADTPGVARSLPRFRALLGPVLRSPEDGADTLVWLAASDLDPLASTGRLWLDRRVRATHRLARTRRADSPAERAKLWAWLVERSGEQIR